MLSFVAKILGAVPKRGSCIAHARTFLSAREREKLDQTIPDARQHIAFVAQMRGLTEDELIQKCSARIHLAYRAPVQPMTINFLPRDWNFGLLRKAGGIFVMIDGLPQSVVCVDPVLFHDVLPKFGNLPMYISTWSAIARALDESEKNFEVIQEDLVQENPDERVLAALCSLIAEVEAYAATSVRVMFSDARIAYQFDTPGGRTGFGTINAELTSGMLASFNRAIDSGRFLSARRLNFFVSGAEREFTLRWEVAPNHKKILLVDDDALFLDVFGRYLAGQKIDYVCASSADEAVEFLKCDPATYAALIFDLHMPKVSGFELVSRARTALGTIAPIFILSADEDLSIRSRLLKAGVFRVLSKNREPRLLLSEITDAIACHREGVM